jgi:two-component system, sensor histidine kinase and response regulator
MTKKGNILIVDDTPENLKVAGNFLKEKEYNIALALNGDDALKILSSTPIDLVLLDIIMPGMNGYDVCEKIKQNPSITDIPVIFLSAKNAAEDIAKGFQKGGADYITKPFQKEELFARCQYHIKLKKIRETLTIRQSSHNKVLENIREIIFS